jgi:hypothetical protein
MANVHVGHHVVHITKSFVELGLVEAIWVITAISTAVLLYEGLFT